jgi:hypothetical protein
MSELTIRPADELDVPCLRKALKEAGPLWEQVDFSRCKTWIAEVDGVPVTSISLRLVFQIEPLLNFKKDGIKRHTLKKAAYLLYREVENFIADPEQNTTGLFWTFCHVLQRRTWKWLEKLGFHHCYSGGRMYCKAIPPKE